jgi:hypothetical protein
MKLTSNFLLLAANYEDMFKAVTALNPAVEADISNIIKWAKRCLRKNDRIVWFLRWYRLVLVEYFTVRSNNSPQWQELLKKIKGDLRSKGMIEEINWRLKDIPELKQELEHYFGLKAEGNNQQQGQLGIQIPEIQNHVFTHEPPNAIIQKFKTIEDEYANLSDRIIIPKPEDKIVLQFADGWAWWLLPRAYCPDESKAMGHCGNSPEAGNPNQQILSLRELKKKGNYEFWEPHCTFIYNKNGYIGEMKGRNNAKPIEKYHAYIVELLKLPMIKGVIGGGYKPQNNFHLSDLSEELYQDLVGVRPEYTSSNDSHIRHIIEVLELEPNAWDSNSEVFVVHQWETGLDFLEDCAVGADEALRWYKEQEVTEPPDADDLMRMLEEASSRPLEEWTETGTVENPRPDYFVNLGYRLMYEFPKRVPEGYNPENHDDVVEFMDILTNNYVKGKSRITHPRKGTAIADLVSLYYVTQPDKDAARVALEQAMEYSDAIEAPYGTELETGDLDDSVRQTLSLDTANKWVQKVEEGDKDVPRWTEGIHAYVDDEWGSFDRNRDYFEEQLESKFGRRPKKPVDRRQRRLFPEPKTEESAKRHGITISSLKSRFLQPL